jgi:hypothetical protein
LVGAQTKNFLPRARDALMKSGRNPARGNRGLPAFGYAIGNVGGEDTEKTEIMGSAERREKIISGPSACSVLSVFSVFSPYPNAIELQLGWSISCLAVQGKLTISAGGRSRIMAQMALQRDLRRAGND